MRLSLAIAIHKSVRDMPALFPLRPSIKRGHLGMVEAARELKSKDDVIVECVRQLDTYGNVFHRKRNDRMYFFGNLQSEGAPFVGTPVPKVDSRWIFDDPTLDFLISYIMRPLRWFDEKHNAHAVEPTIRAIAEVRQKLKEMRSLPESDLNSHGIGVRNVIIYPDGTLHENLPHLLAVDNWDFEFIGDNDVNFEHEKITSATILSTIRNLFTFRARQLADLDDDNEQLRYLKARKAVEMGYAGKESEAIHLVGKSRSGKSTDSKLIAERCPKRLMACLTPADFDNGFVLHELNGKILNFGDDNKIGRLTNEAQVNLKKALGRAPIRNRVKHKEDGETFVSTASMVFTMNQLYGMSTEESESIMNRSIIFYFHVFHKLSQAFEDGLRAEENELWNLLLRWDDADVALEMCPSWWVGTREMFWEIMSDPKAAWVECFCLRPAIGQQSSINGEAFYEEGDDGKIPSALAPLEDIGFALKDWLENHGYKSPDIDYVKRFLKEKLIKKGFKITRKGNKYHVGAIEIHDQDESGGDIIFAINNHIHEQKKMDKILGTQKEDDNIDKILQDLRQTH